MPLALLPDELILGLVSSQPNLAYFAPECFDWSGHSPGKVYTPGDRRFAQSLQFTYTIPEDIAAYWRTQDRGGHVGHFVAGYAKVLRLGFAGIRDEIQRLAGTPGLSARKAAFYETAAFTCRAAESSGGRHADLTRRLATGGSDPARRRRRTAPGAHGQLRRPLPAARLSPPQSPDCFPRTSR